MVRPGRILPEPLIPGYQRLPGVSDLQRFIDLYDGEIRYTDGQIGRLLEALGGDGFLEHNVVIFSTDHGESLGEHDYYLEHGEYLYDQSARVALSIAAPGLDARVVDRPVSNIGVLPTVLGQLGLPVPDAIDGRDLLSRGRLAEASADVTFIEHAAKYKAIRTSEWKLILHQGRKGGTIGRELYHLPSDPAETRNIAGREQERVRNLEYQLRNWMSLDTSPDFYEGVVPEEERNYGARLRVPSDDELEKLRSLGYVD